MVIRPTVRIPEKIEDFLLLLAKEFLVAITSKDKNIIHSKTDSYLLRNLSPFSGIPERWSCILNKRIKVGTLGGRLNVYLQSSGQTSPNAGHRRHAGCSSGRRIHWHIGINAPGKYDAKRRRGRVNKEKKDSAVVVEAFDPSAF